MMEGGSPPPGPRTRREEEEFARLFKPNPQTHSQRLADPWPITNSITGAGTPWYVPPPPKGTTTPKDAGENSRIAQKEATEQAAAHQASGADHHHYTAPPGQFPYFVAANAPGLGPAMTSAKDFVATRFGVMPPQEFFGVPHYVHNPGPYGTYQMAYGPLNTAAMGHGHPANAAYQPRPVMHPEQIEPAYGMQYNMPGAIPAHPVPGWAPHQNVRPSAHQMRIRQNLGSKADFRFPTAEPAMRSRSPPSSASIDEPPAETGQKAGGSAQNFSTPAAAMEGGSAHSRASARSGSSGRRHGLGSGLWPLRGRYTFAGSPPQFSGLRGQKSPSAHKRSPERGDASPVVATGQLIILVDVALDSISRAYSFDENESKQVLSKVLHQSSAVIGGKSPNAQDETAEADCTGSNPQSKSLPHEIQLRWSEFIPLVHENAKLMQMAKDFEKEKRNNARTWDHTLRQMTDAYHRMYQGMEQQHERETNLKKCEAAMNNAHREVQQRLAELDFERAAVIRRSAEKDKEVKDTREQFQRLRDQNVALQAQVNMLLQQNAQIMRQAAPQQHQGPFTHIPFAQPLQPGYQQVTFMPAPSAQPTQPEHPQQGVVGSGHPQQPSHHPVLQQQHFIHEGNAEQFAAYPGHGSQEDVRDYAPPPLCYDGDLQGVVSGPPYEEHIPEFDNPPPPPPATPRPRGDVMAGWDNNELHNMKQSPGSFFSPSGSCHSQAPTLVDENNVSSKLDTQHSTDRAFYTLDDKPNVPETPTYKTTRLVSPPPVQGSDMSSPITTRRPAEHNDTGPKTSFNTKDGFHVVPHPVDDVFVPLTQSPPGPESFWLEPQDYYSKSYTSLLNACFSKIEGVVRMTPIAPIIDKACADDPEALDFMQTCKEHLIDHQEAWTILGDESMQQYLVIGVVQRYVMEYAISDSILTEFKCEHQSEFIRRFEQDVESADDHYNRGSYAISRAQMATTISRLPQFAHWLGSYTTQTTLRIVEAIKPAFQPSRLPWLRQTLLPMIHEALCIGLRMLQDPRGFEYVFPKLGATWDDRFHVHRNPELVGQHLPNENTPYVVRCALRPLVTVTEFEEGSATTTLTVHRAEVLLINSNLQDSEGNPSEEDIQSRVSNPRHRVQGN